MVMSYGVFTMIWFIIFPITVNSGTCVCPENRIDVQNNDQGQQMTNKESKEHVTARKRKRCCPYNFDGKLCRTVGDRVLCGYNINVGRPENGNDDRDLQNGCRIRKGRLECGYDEPPFTNSRRPPVWDYVVPEAEGEDDTVTKNSEILNEADIKKLSFALSTQIPMLLSTRCVEIKERIVCRKI